MRFFVRHVIKLLTLVHDSSMEQKLKLFPNAKVQQKNWKSQTFTKIFASSAYTQRLKHMNVGVHLFSTMF